MRRLLIAAAFVMLWAGSASAQIDIKLPGTGGTGSGDCDPSQWSDPAGTGSFGGSTGACTYSVSTAVVPLYSTGTSDPATCTAGGMFHLRTDSSLLKFCVDADTWAQAVTFNNTTLAGASFFLDEDDMASDSATKVPSQQSVKAYVDAHGGGSGNGFFIGGSLGGNTINASTTSYFGPMIQTVSADETTRYVIIPASCTAKNFYIQHATQNAGGTLVVTVRQNAADTAVTVTIANAGGTGTASDTTHTVAFAAGDQLSFKAVNNWTGASAALRGFGVQCQ